VNGARSSGVTGSSWPLPAASKNFFAADFAIMPQRRDKDMTQAAK